MHLLGRVLLLLHPLGDLIDLHLNSLAEGRAATLVLLVPLLLEFGEELEGNHVTLGAWSARRLLGQMLDQPGSGCGISSFIASLVATSVELCLTDLASVIESACLRLETIIDRKLLSLQVDDQVSDFDWDVGRGELLRVDLFGRLDRLKLVLLQWTVSRSQTECS